MRSSTPWASPSQLPSACALAAFLWLLAARCCESALALRNHGTYAVSQKHRLHIHDSGKVDVVMTIAFQPEPGASLTGSYKSLLFDTSVVTIEDARVIATDGTGETLPLEASHRNGRFKVAFAFAHTLNRTSQKDYVVNLAYSVLNGTCKGADGVEYFGLPWAHRWAVRVMASKYELEFENPKMASQMDAVCFGSSGFSLKCGRAGMQINRTKATYEVTGNPYDAFFEWMGVRSTPDLRLCQASEQAAVKDDIAAPLEQQQEEKVEPFTVGIVALSSSFVAAGIVFLCVKKKPIDMKSLKLKDAEKKALPVPPSKPAVTKSPSPSRRPAESREAALEAGTLQPSAKDASRIGTARRSGIGDSGRIGVTDNGAGVNLGEDLDVRADFEDLEAPPAAAAPHQLQSSTDPSNWEVMEEFVGADRPDIHASVDPQSDEIVGQDSQLRDTGSISCEANQESFADWEVMSDYCAEEILARKAMITNVPFHASAMSPQPPCALAPLPFDSKPLGYGPGQSGASNASPIGDGEKADCPESWQVDEEFNDLEPSAECRCSSQLHL